MERDEASTEARAAAIIERVRVCARACVSVVDSQQQERTGTRQRTRGRGSPSRVVAVRCCRSSCGSGRWGERGQGARAVNARHEACAHRSRCMPAYASKGVGGAGYDKPTAGEPRSARKLLTKSCGG